MANAGYLDTVVMTFKRLNFWKSVKCEFMMTLFYVLFGCGATSSVLVSQNTKDLDVAMMSQYAAALNAALAFGLTAAIMLHCSLRLEGPVHLNPAVTVALLCTRRVNVVTALFHIMAQCLGRPPDSNSEWLQYKQQWSSQCFCLMVNQQLNASDHFHHHHDHHHHHRHRRHRHRHPDKKHI